MPSNFETVVKRQNRRQPSFPYSLPQQGLVKLPNHD